MARRMDVELTSAREDGTFTWRAVGAREPRGLLEQKLAPSGAHVGDVLRVEADFELDGITITSVLPSKSKSQRTNVIEIAARPVTGEVTTSLVGRSARPPRPGGPREGGDRDRPRRDGPGRPSTAGRPGAPAARGARPGTGASAARPAFGEGAASRPRPERSSAPDRPRAPRERPTTRPEGAEGARARPRAAEHGAASAPRPTRARPQRLIPKTVHLDAYLETLPPEQRPIAEQLVTGGLPAVRQALDGERTAARAEGRAGTPGDAILTLAERLVPGVREALWLDRAEAAVAKLEGLSLRDLRAAVLGAAPRDDHGRELLTQLRGALDERVAKLRTAWENDMVHALDEGRVLQALRVSARPPEPTARFPAALVTRLVESASEAMTSATPPDRWLALLEAVVASPVRRSVKPSGLADDPSGAVRQQAQAAAGRVPALAPLLGLTMPPPPRPLPPPPPRTASVRRVPAPPAGRSPEPVAKPAEAEANTAAPVAESLDADRAPTPIDSAPEAEAALSVAVDDVPEAAAAENVIDTPVVEDEVAAEPADPTDVAPSDELGSLEESIESAPVEVVEPVLEGADAES